MHYYEIVPTKIIRLDQDSFTYSSKSKLIIGQLVKIEIGKRDVIGLVSKKVTKPTEYKVKEIKEVLYNKPIPKALLKTLFWISDYYKTHLANVISLSIPRGVDKKRRSSSDTGLETTNRNRTNILLNKDQSSAIKKIINSKPGNFLIHGVTGSGKTIVYIELAKATLRANKSVIVLVPEIGLTSQIVADFSQYFDCISVIHSQIGEANKHKIWQNILANSKPQIIIGPRSALFMPVDNLGLIVVDECHDSSYKQDKTPRYSALRVASVLAKNHVAKVVLGSATPNIEDWFLAKSIDRPIIRLETIATPNSQPASVKTIDMKDKKSFTRHRFLSDELLDNIALNKKIGQQTLIYHNRRGGANLSICDDCGWTSECPNCHLPLSLHLDKHCLMCHICGYKSPVMTSCPDCGNTNIIHKGIGTQLIESELKQLFPDLSIARFDSDNTKSSGLAQKYQSVYDGEVDVIIGTQSIAKGLDLPLLKTVGIIQADTGLALPDYSTNERVYQLITQVIGRVGRNSTETNVILQTYRPDHDTIKKAVNQDYQSFYKTEISSRQAYNYPPFVFLLKLTCTYKNESTAIKNSKALKQTLHDKYKNSIQILGPTPSFYEHKNGSYRWQLIIKSRKRKYLTDIIEHIPSKNWQFELDPPSLL